MYLFCLLTINVWTLSSQLSCIKMTKCFINRKKISFLLQIFFYENVLYNCGGYDKFLNI